MKTDLNTLRESFKMGYDAYEGSYAEADEVIKMSEGAMYNRTQLSILLDRGQPAEYFNVIQMFSRALQGYFSTVVNTMQARALEEGDVQTANAINLALEYTLRMNLWDVTKGDLQQQAFLPGLMGVHYKIKATGQDQFGRQKNEVEFEPVPYYELILDPKSYKPDYSDARFVHRFRWISKEEAQKLFPRTWTKLQSRVNTVDIDTAEIDYTYGEGFTDRWNMFEEYLIVHTGVVDNKGVSWEVWWSGDVELKRQKLDFDSLRFPYRIVKLHSGKKADFHGIFRDVIESQKAINQAILQIQQLANGTKVLVEKNAVDDVDAFNASWARVNAVIGVNKLIGIKEIDVTRDIANQYMIIDRGLDRIKQVLHINDSFLGQTFASDSGKKVALQRNSSMMALRYLTTKLDVLYRSVALDLIHLMRQYMTAQFEVDSTDDMTQKVNWTRLNTPVMLPQPNGTEMPASTVVQGKKGPVREIINDPDYSLIFSRMDIKIESVAYEDASDADKLMIQQTLQSPAGQMLGQAQPGYYFMIASLLAKQTKTMHSAEIGAIFRQAAMALGTAPTLDPRMLNQGPPGGQQPNQETGPGATASAMGVDTNTMNQ